MFKIIIKDTCFGTWKVFEILFPFFSLCVGPGPGETFRVPRMYNTEYQFYGSEKPVTVWLNIKASRNARYRGLFTCTSHDVEREYHYLFFFWKIYLNIYFTGWWTGSCGKDGWCWEGGGGRSVGGDGKSILIFWKILILSLDIFY